MDNTKDSSKQSSSRLTPKPITSMNSDISQASSNGNVGELPTKRLPPIKAPVGLARPPDLKSCKSKVGSLNNIKHTPAGGRVVIPTQKLQWNAKSKVGSLENKEHKPAGGNVKVETRKLEWKTTSKVQSLQNVKHKPGGGNVKIFNETYRNKSPITKSPSNDSNKEGVAPKTEPNNNVTKTESESLAKSLRTLNIK